MKYRFARVWATVQVAAGITLAVLGSGAGLVVIVLPGVWPGLGPAAEALWGGPLSAARALLGVGLVLLGIVVAIPLIVSGQLIHALLDQRALLARISRRLRRWEATYGRQETGPPLGRRLGRRA